MKNLYDSITEHFPEFDFEKRDFAWEDFFTAGDFAQFITQKIRENEPIEKYLHFIEDLLFEAENDENKKNLVQSGIFKSLQNTCSEAELSKIEQQLFPLSRQCWTKMNSDFEELFNNCEICLCKMPESRPSDFCFSLFDGSVFVDFAKKCGLIYLLRISFDGFGCYSVPGDSNPLGKERSKSFLKIVRGGIKDKTELLGLIKTALKINRSLLDADEPLKKYKLLDNANFHFILCRDKFDVASIEKITELELRTNPELYAGLLECFMDMNWPVAKVALGKMIFDDKKVVPYLKAVLASSDDEWIYFVKENVLPLMSMKIKRTLKEVEK